MSLKILVAIFFILLPLNANAERWICYDKTTKEITTKIQGDCLNLGLCTGPNNTGLRDNCFEATEVEWNKAQENFIKFDGSKENKIVDLDQLEKDKIIQDEQDKKDEEELKRNALTDKLRNLGLSDEEILSIIN